MPIKHILIIIIAVGTMYFSMDFWKQWVNDNQERVELPTPAHMIYAGQVISPTDITTRKYLKAAQEPTATVDISEIAGRVAATDLYPSEQIRTDKLLTQESILEEGEARVAVKVDSLEQFVAGSLRPNMLCIIDYTDGDQSSPPTRLSQKAILLGITDDKGNNISGASVPCWLIFKVDVRDLPNFTRPLNGGKVLIGQIGLVPSLTSINSLTTRTTEEQLNN